MEALFIIQFKEQFMFLSQKLCWPLPPTPLINNTQNTIKINKFVLNNKNINMELMKSQTLNALYRVLIHIIYFSSNIPEILLSDNWTLIICQMSVPINFDVLLWQTPLEIKKKCH
jgi:hypothetical protein